MEVYMDNASTTAVDEGVVKEMSVFFDDNFGNASSLHFVGEEAKKALEDARERIAKSIGAKSSEIVFTSGGTESNNLAIKGVALANKGKGNHIITTKIEHKSVLESCKWLEGLGFEISYLDVDEEGFVSISDLEDKIRPETILVSVIHGNNEVGTIQNIDEIGRLCRSNKIYFHTDACQSYTKTKLNVGFLDLVSLNSHKIHGPKGVGALYVRDGTKIKEMNSGGGQEMKIRSGTENVAGIVGFAKAVEMISKEDIERMTKLRDKMIDEISKIEGVGLNGAVGDNRLCNNVNFSFRGIEGEAIGGYLSAEGVCSSTGSACVESSLEPSHVLLAMGKLHGEANGSLRLTLSKFTTEKEVDYVLNLLPKVVDKLRKMSPIGVDDVF